MKKLLFFGLASLLTTSVFSQVGIGTKTPKATLDVVGKPTDATALDGIIAPRLTGNQLQAKTYTAAETGAKVYVTAAATAPAGQTINVTATGEYVFDGAAWQKLAFGARTKFVDGTNPADAVYTAGKVGIGTTTPTTSLDVKGTLSDTQRSGVSSVINPVTTGTTGYIVANNFGYETLPTDASTHTYGVGVSAGANHKGTGTIVESRGTTSEISNTGSGTIASAFGTYNEVTNWGTGTITNMVGTFSNISNRGVGTTVNAAGYGTQVYPTAGSIIENATGVQIGIIGGTVSGRGISILSVSGSAGKAHAIYSEATAPSYFAGAIGIGTTTPTAKLHVTGNVIATGGYADYVLEDYVDGASVLNAGYARKSLEEVDQFIKTNKHLPGVTAVKDLKIASNGEYEIDITKLQVQLLEKVEELYLHTIEQQKQIDALKAELSKK